MPMTLSMTWMERTCKADASALSWHVIHVTAVVAALAAVVVEAAAGVAAEAADPVATLLAQGPTTDWWWRTCLLAPRGR